MNILIPHSWLEEYVTLNLKPEALAQAISLCGPSFEHVLTIEDEAVYDIEVTTNRVDAMSVKGMAREIATILVQPLKSNKYPSITWLQQNLQKATLPLPKIEVETDKINKIVTIVLDQVKNQVSPAWLQKRLRQIGQNSHGIIIDVTNYITHELGHPCHAFDYDKIMALGGVIKVKKALPGKKFTTLNGIDYQTFGGEIVFENNQGEIIDLPAVKGTLNTAIDERTKRVLFWLENMDAMLARQASMKHAIRTVAAQLNEKNVDPMLMEETLMAGVQLLTQLAKARLASPLWQYQKTPIIKPQWIKLDLDRVDNYLGVTIETEQVEQILTHLGFTIKKTKKRQWQVLPASFRSHDVQMEADLIEEVARIYGYHRLPSRIDFPLLQIPKQKDVYFALEYKFKQFLADRGLSEVYTYSMVAEEQVEGSLKNYLTISNPLSVENVVMRQSLIPSLMAVWQENKNFTLSSHGIFELAKTYFPGKKANQVTEKTVLTLLTSLPYRETRALLEQMLALVYLQIDINNKGEIRLGQEKIGQIKMMSSNWWALEIELAPIGNKARVYPLLQKLSPYPALVEDLTFNLKGLALGPMIKKMKQVSSLLQKVQLKDSYQDNYTFTCVYQSQRGVLNNQQIAPLRQKIVDVVEAEGGRLIGDLSSLVKIEHA